VVKLAGLSLLPVLGVLCIGGSLLAQENKPAEEAKARAQDRRPSLVVAGYTRPGNPSDRAKGGKILPGGYLAGNADFKGIGGTVFFAFRLTREEGDVWGTGAKGFDETFVPGVDFNNVESPLLDTRAKYLYLYQVVNSRGLDPISPVIFAVNKERSTQPIAAAAVRLRVDPRYITSWGAFKATGLTLSVLPRGLEEKKAAADKDKPGAVKPALDEEREGFLRMAVSVNPSILGALPTSANRFRAPSHLLRRVRVDDATLNLVNTNAMKELQKRALALEKNNEKPAAWVGQMLRSAKAATEPTAVRLGLSEPDARLYLQAEWKTQGGAGLLNLADHSSVFGFTTDLPPVPEPFGIAAPEARENLLAVLGGLAGDVAGTAGAVVPAAWVGAGPGDDSGVAPAAAHGVAPGTAVGPIQPAAFTPAVTHGAGISTFGSALAPPAGFGAGFPGWPGVGAFGRAFPPTTNGGGFGGGSGSGNNNGTQAQNQKEQQQGNQNLINNISIDISLSNQQSQNQSQHQHQNQHQRQSQRNRHHVVPEPGTLLLGLLGLPALIFSYRRRKMAQAAAIA
jgi:hypothetical protein